MKDKSKLFIIASFWLVVSILAILAFAGIISPRRAISNNTQAELLHPATGAPGEKLEVSLVPNGNLESLHAALSLDLGNRHAVIDQLDLPGNLEKIVIDRKRQLAFLANSFSGLQILDISEPSRNRLIGAIGLPGNAWDIKIRGNILFMAAAKGGLQIIDVSNPEKPRQISELILPRIPLLKLALYKDTIYATSGKKGMQIIDISNLNSPQLIARGISPGGSWGLSVAGRYLYLSGGKHFLSIFSLQNPNKPVLTSQVKMPGMIWEMGFKENYLYAPTRKGGLIVLDISDKAHPVLLDPAYKDNSVETISIEGNKAVLSNRMREIFVYNLDNPARPTRALVADLYFRPRNITVHNNIFYVAGGLSGLKVIDSNRISRQRLLKSFHVPGNLQQVISDRDFYYLATVKHGLFIARRNSDGHPPTMIASVKIPGTVQNMVRSGDHLYLACSSAGLQVVDISEPQSPQLIADRNYPGYFRDIAGNGKQLYIASANEGLLVFNTTFPGNPILTGVITLPGPMQVHARDERAYVATTGAGLHIIDVSNPADPVEISQKSLPWPLQEFAKFHQISVTGQSVFLAAGVAELIHYDISDEKNPEIAEIIHMNGETLSVKAHRDQVFATTRQGRLWIMQEDNGKLTHRAVTDILGNCNNIQVMEDYILLANGLKGLTFLPWPKLLTISAPAETYSRARKPAVVSIAIPLLKQSATYNLALFNQTQLREFVGAVKVTGESK